MTFADVSIKQNVVKASTLMVVTVAAQTFDLVPTQCRSGIFRQVGLTKCQLFQLRVMNWNFVWCCS